MTHVVIIGARAAGVATLVQLVSSLADGARITVVDPDDPSYPAVFGDTSADVIANTSAQIGSLVATDGSDFVDFIGPGADPHAVPRRVVGGYIRFSRERARAAAVARSFTVRQVSATATRITRSSAGYGVHLSTGERIDADDVVLAMGSGPAKRLPGVPAAAPFPTDALVDRAAARALVIGTGPSAIDAALTLADHGTHVHMASRHGLFPAVRTRTIRTRPVRLDPSCESIDIRRTLIEHTEARGRSVGHLLHSATAPAFAGLQRDIENASPDRSPWQDGLADIVDLLGSRRLTIRDEPAFVWRHLTSIMRATAIRLERAMLRGDITVGRIGAVDTGTFPLIVAAIGYEPYPLFATPSTLYLGPHPAEARPVATLDDDLRLVLPGGAGSERIWAVGPTAGIARTLSTSLSVTVAHSASVARSIAALSTFETSSSVADEVGAHGPGRMQTHP